MFDFYLKENAEEPMGWGPEKIHTEKREAASLHQAAVSRMGLGTTPGGRGWLGWCWVRPEALPGCAGQSQGPAGSAGCWVLGGGLSLSLAQKAHQAFPCLAIVRVTVPQGPVGCSGGPTEDGDFPENTVGASLWGRSGGRERGRAFVPGRPSATTLTAALPGAAC